MFTPVDVIKRFGSNRWYVFSTKLQRKVTLYSDLEYDHWVLIEMTPSIQNYCEQPLKISFLNENGKISRSIFDMWINQNGIERFVEVKHTYQLKGGAREDARSIRQVAAQEAWCRDHGYIHEVATEKTIRKNPILLSNMKLLLPYLLTHQTLNSLEVSMMKFIKAQGSPVSLEFIHDKFHLDTFDSIWAVLAHGRFAGTLSGNLDELMLCKKSEVFNNEITR